MKSNISMILCIVFETYIIQAITQNQILIICIISGCCVVGYISFVKPRSSESIYSYQAVKYETVL